MAQMNRVLNSETSFDMFKTGLVGNFAQLMVGVGGGVSKLLVSGTFSLALKMYLDNNTSNAYERRKETNRIKSC